MKQKIAIGTANFGLNYGINNSAGKLCPESIAAILDYSNSAGIDTIDTASLYGTSEIELGNYFGRNGCPFNVISKLPFCKIDEIENHFLKSLSDLHIQKLYGYLFHSFKMFESNPEAFEYIGKFKEQGKVEKIGFSLYYPSELELLLNKDVKFDLLQIPYNIFDRRFEPYFSELKKRNVEIHVRSVFLQGLLFKVDIPYFFEPMKDKIHRLHSIADENEIDLQTLCLSYVISNNNIDKAVMGFDNLGQLSGLTDSLGKFVLADEIKQELDKLKEYNEQMIVPVNWKTKNVLCLVQARYSSTRLPGKVLMPLGGETVLGKVFLQLSYSKEIGKSILATSVDSSDDRVADWAAANEIEYFRGSLGDVLDRFYQAAKHFKADVVVRITADCPLIDPEIVDKVIKLFNDSGVDYASNINPPTFPDGYDTEVFSFAALETAWKQASLGSEREHVTPYIRNNTELFKSANLGNDEDLSKFRLTLDNPEDYTLLNEIHKFFDKKNSYIKLDEVIKLLRSNASFSSINSHIQRNEGYLKSLNSDKAEQND